MELSQIRYFLAVAESLNFTSAAAACAVSQPALSKAIRKLEENLGAELFERDTQHVKLTEFGRTMRVHFERIEDSRRKARDAAKAATRALIEPLNVGVMCTVGPRRFSGFLESFRAGNPLVDVTLHDATAPVIPDLLLSGALDCVFCARASDHDPRFRVVELFHEKMVVAFAPGHRFEQLEAVSLEEVAKETYLDRLHCEFRDDFLSMTRASGLELEVAMRSEREDWILELLRRGMGVSVLPSSSAIPETLGFRPISDTISDRKLELVMTVNATVSPALAAFHDAASAYDWS